MLSVRQLKFTAITKYSHKWAVSDQANLQVQLPAICISRNKSLRPMLLQHGEPYQTSKTDTFAPSVFFIPRKFTKSLRGTLVSLKAPLPRQKQWNVVCQIPCPDCLNANVGQTCRQRSGTERPSSEKGPRDIRAILSRHGTQPSHVSINS